MDHEELPKDLEMEQLTEQADAPQPWYGSTRYDIVDLVDSQIRYKEEFGDLTPV